MVDVVRRIVEPGALRIRKALDCGDTLLDASRGFDCTTVLHLAKHRQQKRLIDLRHRDVPEVRKDITLQTGNDIVGVDRLPAVDLQGVPVSSRLLEGFCSSSIAYQSEAPYRVARVATLTQNFFSSVPFLSRLGQGHVGVCTQRQQPFLLLEAVLVAPAFMPGGRNVKVKASAVGKLVGLIFRFRCAYRFVRQHPIPHS